MHMCTLQAAADDQPEKSKIETFARLIITV